MRDFTWFDWIGAAGAAAILFAFLWTLLGRWRNTQPIYRALNFGGASAVALSLLFRPNPAALAVEVLWAVVSFIGLIKPNWLRGAGQGPGERMMDEEDAPYFSIWRWLWPPHRWHAWQLRRYNQMQHRRAWRLFDAACASVRMLADHVRSRGPISSEDVQPLTQELRSIRYTLDRNALSCIAPSSGAALNELFEVAEKTTQGSASLPNNLASALDALLRALEAQRRTLAAWAPAGTRAATPARDSPLPPRLDLPLTGSSRSPDGVRPADSDAPLLPEEPAEDQKLTRDEAAILAGLTEKFYKSWIKELLSVQNP
jgi:hypothetical protein